MLPSLTPNLTPSFPAGLVGGHAAIGEDEAGHVLRGEVVDEVLHPGEVGVAQEAFGGCVQRFIGGWYSLSEKVNATNKAVELGFRSLQLLKGTAKQAHLQQRPKGPCGLNLGTNLL